MLNNNKYENELCNACSVNYRITDRLRLEGTSRCHLVKPPAETGPSRNACPWLCLDTFEYLQEWKHHNFPGQPVPGLSDPHSERVFPDVQSNTAVV